MRYLKNKYVLVAIGIAVGIAAVLLHNKYGKKSPVSDSNPNSADTATAPPPNAQTNAPQSLRSAEVFAYN